MRDRREEVSTYIHTLVNSLTPSEKAYVARLVTGAMSFGSISLQAHQDIAEAVNNLAMAIHGVKTMAELIKLGAHARPLTNSGEGGEKKSRNGTIFQSRMRQIATARFGVNAAYLANAVILEIKYAQGAKPGSGGELLGVKVTKEIAETRLTEPGITLISPAPGHDLYSIEALKQLIFDLISANPEAIISVKVAANDGIKSIVAGLVRAGAKNITIAGSGGTGAAANTAKYDSVIPWEIALNEVDKELRAQGLRNQVTLTVSGGIQTGEDCAKAIVQGADFIEAGTGILIALDCVMRKVCHEGTCPKGIATQNPTLIAENYTGKPEHVANYLVNLGRSTNAILARYGFTDPAQAVGRTDLLSVDPQSAFTGLEALLVRPAHVPQLAPLPQPTGSSPEENSVIGAIREGETHFIVHANSAMSSFGARMAYFMQTDPTFAAAFSKAPVKVTFAGGVIGQSFGFVAPEGLTLVTDMSNDDTGKSLDGAKIFVKQAMGDQTGFGATRGFIYGDKSGERTGIRNSGAHIVVRKVGAMSANFMTGGSLTVFGKVGANFGAGFFGGTIYLLKEAYDKAEQDMFLAQDTMALEPEPLSPTDVSHVKTLLSDYLVEIPNQALGAIVGSENWEVKFIKLDPTHKKLNPVVVPARAIEHPSSIPSVSSENEVPELLPSIDAIPTPADISASVLGNTGSALQDREKSECGIGVLIRRDGVPAHKTIEDAVKMLERLEHRGFGNDGCGIRIYGVDDFFKLQFPALNLEKGGYCIVPIYLSQNEAIQGTDIALFKELLAKEGLSCAGKRIVPVNQALLEQRLAEQRKLPEDRRAPEPELQQFVVLKPEECTPEEFEHKLIRTRLRFKLQMQLQTGSKAPSAHILSASPYFVIYTTLMSIIQFGHYFLDLKHPMLKAACVEAHARASTNTGPRLDLAQPLPNYANNGENNNLRLFIDWLEKTPYLKQILGIKEVTLGGLSDSTILSIFMDVQQLFGLSPLEIIKSTIHPFAPQGNATTQFYQLFTLPAIGPCAGILHQSNKLVAFRDRQGLRPFRGIESAEYISLGSEWGIVDGPGRTLRLKPGQPWVIDLQTCRIKKYDPENGVLLHEQARFQLAQSHVSKEQEDMPHEPSNLQPLRDKPHEIQRRQLRAGWNPETDASDMQPLFKRKKAMGSMANQGPLETTIADVSLRNLFHFNFSQVMNPPTALVQERPYLSTEIFLGRKPALDKLHEEVAKGVILRSPVIDNATMADLMAAEQLKVDIFDITFFFGSGRQEDFLSAVDKITQAVIYSVRRGTSCVILSDCNVTEGFVAIPAPLICSMVHTALQTAGIRHQTGLVLQSSEIIFGRDVAQAISIGGCDAVNPYLAYLTDNNTEYYADALADEVLSHMARLGVTNIPSYQTGAFTAVGLHPEVAALYRVRNVPGKIDLDELLRIISNTHSSPSIEGTGRHKKEGSVQHPQIWNPEVVMLSIEAARTGNLPEAFKKMETAANTLRDGFPRGALKFVPSRNWNAANPLPVCILGGGAAGFYQAQALLDSGLPITITLIEQNWVNRFGLVGDGVAPDHPDTKAQQLILQQCIKDERFSYHGGVKVTDSLLSKLKLTYPCIIDCRGASEDNKLGIKGEDLPVCIPASTVYRAYNRVFNPYPSESPAWPLTDSRSVVVIIGLGEVAGDIARILLSHPDKLEGTPINTEFLRQLRSKAPKTIHIFARGNPSKAAIGLKSLHELQAMNIGLTATFIEEEINLTDLTAKQIELYEFFRSLQDIAPTNHEKRVHFHFQMTPVEFVKKGVDIEARFTNGETITARNIITALGTTPTESSCEYTSGWKARKGGNLSLAFASVDVTTNKIKQDFAAGVFNERKGPEEGGQSWKLKTRVTNAGLMGILSYLAAGKKLANNQELLRAIHYGQQQVQVETTITHPVHELPIQQPRVIRVRDANGDTHDLQPRRTNFLTLFKMDMGRKLAPKHECDGGLICGTCVVQAPEFIPRTATESKLLRLKNYDPRFFMLACAHELGAPCRAGNNPAEIEDLVMVEEMTELEKEVQKHGISFNIP